MNKLSSAPQVVEPDASNCRILMVDLSAEADKADTTSALASWLAREAAVPFEPYSAPPVRAMLAQLGDDDHALLVLMHHVSPAHLCCEMLNCASAPYTCSMQRWRYYAACDGARPCA